jgi:hypothetical protein
MAHQFAAGFIIAVSRATFSRVIESLYDGTPMRLGLCTILLALAVCAPTLLPQTPTTHDQTHAYTLKVESRAVVVDVTVIDAKGEPVTGLRKGDFEVTEDGTPQPLSTFARQN